MTIHTLSAFLSITTHGISVETKDEAFPRATGIPQMAERGIYRKFYRLTSSLRLIQFWGMLPWGFGNGKMLGIENRQIANNRYQGNLAGFGISYGYQWMISPQWNMEAGISLGYAHLNYKRYGQPAGAP